MEDIQDGIKISIQDGVEEDPELLALFEIAGKSFVGAMYVAREITCPEITTALNVEGSGDKGMVGAIATTVGVVAV